MSASNNPLPSTSDQNGPAPEIQAAVIPKMFEKIEENLKNKLDIARAQAKEVPKDPVTELSKPLEAKKLSSVSVIKSTDKPLDKPITPAVETEAPQRNQTPVKPTRSSIVDNGIFLTSHLQDASSPSATPIAKPSSSSKSLLQMHATLLDSPTTRKACENLKVNIQDLTYKTLDQLSKEFTHDQNLKFLQKISINLEILQLFFCKDNQYNYGAEELRFSSPRKIEIIPQKQLPSPTRDLFQQWKEYEKQRRISFAAVMKERRRLKGMHDTKSTDVTTHTATLSTNATQATNATQQLSTAKSNTSLSPPRKTPILTRQPSAASVSPRKLQAKDPKQLLDLEQQRLQHIIEEEHSQLQLILQREMAKLDKKEEAELVLVQAREDLERRRRLRERQAWEEKQKVKQQRLIEKIRLEEENAKRREEQAEKVRRQERSVEEERKRSEMQIMAAYRQKIAIIKQSAQQTEERKKRILTGHESLMKTKRQSVYEKQQSKISFIVNVEVEKRAMSTLKKDEKEERIQSVLGKAGELLQKKQEIVMAKVGEKEVRLKSRIGQSRQNVYRTARSSITREGDVTPIRNMDEKLGLAKERQQIQQQSIIEKNRNLSEAKVGKMQIMEQRERIRDQVRIVKKQYEKDRQQFLSDLRNTNNKEQRIKLMSKIAQKLAILVSYSSIIFIIQWKWKPLCSKSLEQQQQPCWRVIIHFQCQRSIAIDKSQESVIKTPKKRVDHAESKGFP